MLRARAYPPRMRRPYRCPSRHPNQPLSQLIWQRNLTQNRPSNLLRPPIRRQNRAPSQRQNRHPSLLRSLSQRSSQHQSLLPIPRQFPRRLRLSNRRPRQSRSLRPFRRRSLRPDRHPNLLLFLIPCPSLRQSLLRSLSLRQSLLRSLSQRPSLLRSPNQLPRRSRSPNRSPSQPQNRCPSQSLSQPQNRCPSRRGIRSQLLHQQPRRTRYKNRRPLRPRIRRRIPNRREGRSPSRWLRRGPPIRLPIHGCLGRRLLRHLLVRRANRLRSPCPTPRLVRQNPSHRTPSRNVWWRD